MKIEFTGRNFNLTPAIKKHVAAHLKKTDSFLAGAIKAHVILSVEKHHRHLAEIIVNWQDQAMTSTAETTDMYASVAQAVDRLRRQALKVKGRIIDRKHHALAASAVAPSPVPPVAPSKPAPRIIRTRSYSVKPMTPEEAVLRVSDASEQFLVFRNSETDRVGVIYKRKDGNFGLIEP